MSVIHPIIAVTGSSGAGTSSVCRAFKNIFTRAEISAAIIAGDGFHRYNREDMDRHALSAAERGESLTHFGMEGNCFDLLEELFRNYAHSGSGQYRYYVHDDAAAEKTGYPAGSLTPWEELDSNSDLLFYEGLHGGLVTAEYNVRQYVDLLIGVVPIINLEWIQKIHRDQHIRGYARRDAVEMILERMHDYTHYITPQFSRTDINFQRVPTVDTANPFATDHIPTENESFVVVHIRHQDKFNLHCDDLLQQLSGSFISAPDTLVIPANELILAIQIILAPVIAELVANARKTQKITTAETSR